MEPVKKPVCPPFLIGEILYLLTPNMQVDRRAGFGLSGRPDDLFTGAGYSVRF